MVAAGVGCALALDGLIHTQGTPLTFRPLEPRVETHLNLVWKKYHPLPRPQSVSWPSFRRPSRKFDRFYKNFTNSLDNVSFFIYSIL